MHVIEYENNTIADCECPIAQDHEGEIPSTDWREPDTIAEFRGEV